MRAPISLTSVAIVLAGSAAGAQNGPPRRLELDWLRTPTSPAFTLLDVNPATVARPTTPRALATELVSSTSRGTVIPNNYAVEFAPYWLTPKPALTYQQYLEPSRWQSLRQSFSVSMATARGDTSAPPTRVALGVRALPSSGRVSSGFLARSDSLTTLEDIYLDSLNKYVNARSAGDSARLAKVLDAQAESMRGVAERMGEEERVGFFWEIASAFALAFPGEDFDEGRFSRYGAWTTATYRLDAPRLDFLGLLRFLHSTGADGQNGLDVGGRLHWALGDLGLSSEWVSRTAFQVVSTVPTPGTRQSVLTITSSSRVVGIVDYRAADDLHLTMSFGQDYSELGEERRPLVARFGMQLSYGDKPLVFTPPPKQ